LAEIQALLVKNKVNADNVSNDTTSLYLAEISPMDVVPSPSKPDEADKFAHQSLNRPPSIFNYAFEPQMVDSMVYSKTRAAKTSGPPPVSEGKQQLIDEVIQRQKELKQIWDKVDETSGLSVAGALSKPRLDIASKYSQAIQKSHDDDIITIHEANEEMRRKLEEVGEAGNEKRKALEEERNREMEGLARAYGKHLDGALEKNDKYVPEMRWELLHIMADLKAWGVED